MNKNEYKIEKARKRNIMIIINKYTIEKKKEKKHNDNNK
jgi:hypothetical protein